MKKDIHPQYYNNAKVICVCGNTWETGSTQPEIKVEVCSVCHPFYTGKQRLVDSARRVEKFQEKVAKKEEKSKIRRGKKVKKEMRASKRKSIAEKTEKSSPYAEASGDRPAGREIKGTKKSDKINTAVNTIVNKVNKKLKNKTNEPETISDSGEK